MPPTRSSPACATVSGLHALRVPPPSLRDGPEGREAAALAEYAAGATGRFWDIHDTLMQRGPAHGPGGSGDRPELGLKPDRTAGAGCGAGGGRLPQRGRHGALGTLTFFINGRRYEDRGRALAEVMLGSVGHRLHTASLNFARWALTGLLLVMTVPRRAHQFAVRSGLRGPVDHAAGDRSRRPRIRAAARRLDQRRPAQPVLSRRGPEIARITIGRLRAPGSGATDRRFTRHARAGAHLPALIPSGPLAAGQHDDRDRHGSPLHDRRAGRPRGTCACS